MNELFVQRAVGAGVVFGVLFVVAALLPAPQEATPPDESPGQRIRIDLSERPAPPPEQPLRVPRPVSPEADRPAGPAAGETESAAAEPVPPPPEQKPEIRPQPERKPETVAKPEPKPEPVGEWRVQVASFSEIERARRVIGTFGQQKLPAFRESVSVNGRQVHRVILGPFAAETQAREARQRAVAEGFADSRIQRRDDSP